MNFTSFRIIFGAVCAFWIVRWQQRFFAVTKRKCADSAHFLPFSQSLEKCRLNCKSVFIKQMHIFVVSVNEYSCIDASFVSKSRKKNKEWYTRVCTRGGGFETWLVKIISIRDFKLSIWLEMSSYQCLRPYHVEHTSSRPITEVKQRRARLVLGWVTAWEHRVL